MGWITKRKRDLEKFRRGLNRRKISEAEKEKIRRKIDAHDAKVDATLEFKRQSLERERGRASQKQKKNYSYCKKRIRENKEYANAVKMILDADDLTLAKLKAVQYLVNKGIPETEAYNFADRAAQLEKANYAEVLITPKKREKGA